MRYLNTRMEWETFYKVDVLLLCSETGKNLNADKQNPKSKTSKQTHFLNQDHFESKQ